MMDSETKPQSVLIYALLGLLTLLFLFYERGLLFYYFTNTNFLGGLIVVEIVIACMWRFEKIFFPMTMGCFLAGAIVMPFGLEYVAFTVRWVFLAIGGIAGFVIWMKKDRSTHFELFHMTALFCVLSAIASASASTHSSVALLKVASLFLLFLYASTGGRVALMGREGNFVRWLVLACEVVAFATAAFYVVGFHLFGNPNNMGAMFGVIVTPVLLWGAVTAETRWQTQRRFAALTICGLLLAFSVCRAAIMADGVITVAFTLAIRRPKMLMRVAFAAVLLVEIMGVVSPARTTELLGSMTGRFIFKTEGQTNTGIFGSRRAPWEDTMASLKKHPWFGTGFGTSDFGERSAGEADSSVYTKEGTNREHGSSYLAMAEYMGLLGILPFIFLIILLLRAAWRVWRTMRTTASPYYYAGPFALIAIAGLIHAAFEDWLFAAGSYLCFFFWVTAFLLIDLAPSVRREEQRSARVSSGGFAAASYAGASRLQESSVR